MTASARRTSSVPAPDSPELAELRRRYRALDSPLAVPSALWTPTRAATIDLTRFGPTTPTCGKPAPSTPEPDRGSPTCCTPTRCARSTGRGCSCQLDDDRAFGAVLFGYHDPPVLSRDLLDSVNELCFLDRAFGLFERSELTVLDVGAGYGRLAHRMTQAVPNLRRYYCADAIPESTYICDHYLRYRHVDKTAVTVPLRELRDQLTGVRVDLAVGIRSLSEMTYSAMTGWFDLLDELSVPVLYAIPNDSRYLASRERDGTRRGALGDLTRRGFTLTADEPVIADPDIRVVTGWNEHHLLLTR